jgi:hexosaminidase
MTHHFWRSAAAVAALGCSVTTMADHHKLNIIPKPVKAVLTEGSFSVTPDTVIEVQGNAQVTADFAASELGAATGFSFKGDGKSRIIFRIDSRLGRLGPEGYTVSVTPSKALLSSSDDKGLFYAYQTLRQMMPPGIYSAEKVEGVEWTIPCAEIEDKPRFVWRGAMMDSARHFMPKEAVLKFIDVMAIHKMNSFHWHLTEDQGWRIEIKKYPRLTEVGAWRDETLIGRQLAQKRQNWKFDGIRTGGFYTQDDVREVVAYAAERHINVMPEIEMPGHAQAALSAYPHLGTTGKELPVMNFWGVSKNIFSVEETTFNFLFDVLEEVLEIFPSKFIHIGGDEVPKAHWEADPLAQQIIKDEGLKDEHELQSWFIKRVDDWLTQRGRRLVGWDEILEGGLAKGATVMSWRGAAGGIEAARLGHDVVMAPNSHTYFDQYQSRNKASEPIAVGGLTDLSEAYSYDPVDPAFTPEQRKHVLGSQCQLWTEYIKTPAKLEYMAYPRMSAFSEVLWTEPEAKEFSDFRSRLAAHVARLAMKKVNFRPLDPSPIPPRGH